MIPAPDWGQSGHGFPAPEGSFRYDVIMVVQEAVKGMDTQLDMPMK